MVHLKWRQGHEKRIEKIALTSPLAGEKYQGNCSHMGCRHMPALAASAAGLVDWSRMSLCTSQLSSGSTAVQWASHSLDLSSKHTAAFAQVHVVRRQPFRLLCVVNV
jgi:hypothetical protein